MKSGPDLDELREVLSYSTCEAPPNPTHLRLEEDERVF
jgi:hypothetical protein